MAGGGRASLTAGCAFGRQVVKTTTRSAAHARRSAGQRRTMEFTHGGGHFTRLLAGRAPASSASLCVVPAPSARDPPASGRIAAHGPSRRPPRTARAAAACCFSESPRHARVTGDDHARLGDDAESLVTWIGNAAFMRSRASATPRPRCTTASALALDPCAGRSPARSTSAGRRSVAIRERLAGVPRSRARRSRGDRAGLSHCSLRARSLREAQRVDDRVVARGRQAVRRHRQLAALEREHAVDAVERVPSRDAADFSMKAASPTP